MKIKNTILAAMIAAATLLTGCTEQDKSSDDASSTENASSVDTESSNSTVQGGSDNMAIVSAKPKEIDGFLGNTVEVTPKSGDLIATFEIEGFGTIKAVLFPEAAPIGVENFQKLAESGYFKGLTIHRVVNDFMLQGGSLNGEPP